MTKQKNALTKYLVAAPVEGPGEPVYNELAKWISSITDDSDEETQDTGYYDGDGTAETEIISIKKKYSFEGLYDDDDPAMKFIGGMEFEAGDKRKIMFKQIRSNGDTFEGKATVSDIKVTGGEATEYAAFECSISWDVKPKITIASPLP